MTLIDTYKASLDTELRRRTEPLPHSPDLVYGMIHYHLGWIDRDFRPASVDPGKRIRPTILLLATTALDGDWEMALPAAAAIELLHNFTLVHDDIEDRDDTRRGRPTLWSLWGVPQAINAGDALFSLSYQSLLALDETGLPADRILTAAKRYTLTILRITEGQCRDLSFESEDVVDEETYLSMIEGKTAALIGLAAELGAVISGAPAGAYIAMREFGEGLGRAFQMYDDLLGLWGDPKKTGKPVGSDLLKGKKTLPILHGLAHSSALRDLLLEQNFSAEQVPQALAELEAAGSRAHTEARAEVFHRQALTALDASGGRGEAHATLRALAESLLHRQK